MRAYLSTHLLVALHTTIIALVVIGAAWYVDRAREKMEFALQERIEATVYNITNLALLTDRNDADELTASIIVDCPRRELFENLLQGLGTASKKDLITAQQLFESCGAFFSERKALMVAELTREYESLESYLALLTTLRDLTPEESRYRTWDTVIELEKARSALLSEQTTIQGEIITLLIEGGNGSRINELVRQAQGVAKALTETDAKIDTHRGALVPQT